MANFDTHQHVNYKTAYIMTKGGGGGGGGEIGTRSNSNAQPGKSYDELRAIWSLL